MKIDKKILLKNKLLKLKLLETRIYENNYENLLKTTEVASKLKKALSIIYKYHVYNKKILFVGASTKSVKGLEKLLKNSKHIILPKSIWMNGIITNKQASLKYLRKNRSTINNNFSETLFKLNKRVDLIVILDSYFKNNILNEGYIANIPIIFLGNFSINSNFKASYTIPGNFKFFKKKIRDQLFYLLLVASLKKVNKIKTRKPIILL